jgi:hypothetical protein
MKRNLFVLGLCVTIVAKSLFAESPGQGHVKPIKKAVLVRGDEWKLSAAAASDQAILRITKSTVQTSEPTLLAEIYVGLLGPGGSDFSVSPTGELLWVVLQRNDIRRGGLAWIIYPLVLGEGESREHFVSPTITRQIRRGGRADAITVVSSLNLTVVLRRLVIARWKKGAPLSLGRKVGVSNVRIECGDSGVAVVSGDIGPAYAFTGQVGLGKNHKVWTSDFVISEVNQKEGVTGDAEAAGAGPGSEP